ncbi:MAG: hypothetical protein KDJ73_01130 [Notoacmeibacter sp.]|nr:hypothetical protein [Notoacmeibacter sp.]
MSDQPQREKVHWTERLPLWPLVFATLVVGLAPYFPEPHIVEKFRWYMEGKHFGWMDVLDIPWHLWPAVLLAAKLLYMYENRPAK